MPPEMRNDTALMDRIHAYLPGWDVPKLTAALFTDHFGLVSDFLAECWTRLRFQTRVNRLHGRVQFGGPERPRHDRRAEDRERPSEVAAAEPGRGGV
jgi:predicted ATP-dependent Lon-type protease